MSISKPCLFNFSLAAPTVMARENRVKEMSRTRDLYNKLAESVAPSIWEMDDVKKGVLLQLFGGLNKDMGSQGKSRGEINVLLCGDPGTSKSQLLSYVHRIAPRGIYTSGKGSSAVGLTAYITKDPDTREPILESGALVLSDRCVTTRRRMLCHPILNIVLMFIFAEGFAVLMSSIR